MKYANLKFTHEQGLNKNILLIDSIAIKVSGKPGKWFTNIPLHDATTIKLDREDEQCELYLSDEKTYHPDQLAFNEKYNIKTHQLDSTTIYYSLSGDTVSPKKILVTFPGVSNFDNVNYRLSALTSLQARLKHTLIIALQDKEGVYGNYLYKDSYGNLFKPVVKSLITGLQTKFSLLDRDLIFYGNSKGGSIAIDYIDIFSNSYFFIDIPQLDLYNYLSQNELMRYSLGLEAREKYNFIKYLPSIVNKNVTYSFAENDHDASRNLPMKLFSKINVAMLKDMPHSGSAMQLVKRQFSKIIQLISEAGPIERPEINAHWQIDNGLIFFNRTLGSFTDPLDVNKVYAEVEFYNSYEKYCISLNNSFTDKLIVSWTNGFNAIKHLPDGNFRMKLHVYTNYREYVYPLSGEFFICNGVIYNSYNDYNTSWSYVVTDDALTD